MRRILEWLAAHSGIAFPLSLALGLLVPPLAATIRPVLPATVLALAFLILVRTDLAAAAGELRRPAGLLAVIAAALLLSPPAALGAAWLLGLGPGLTAAWVVSASAPPFTSAPAFARIMGLDASFALSGAVGGMLLTPFSAPALALSLAGLDLALTWPALMLRLGVFVGLPMLAAIGVRRAVPAWLAAQGRSIDGLTVLVLCIFATAVMDGVGLLAWQAPARAGGMLLAAFALNLGLFAAGLLAFAALGGRRAATAGLLLGNRQMALMLAVLPADAPQDVTLFLAIAQLPLYLSPAVLRPLLRRLRLWP